MKAKAIIVLKISIIIFIVIRHLLFSMAWPATLSIPYSTSYLLLLIIEPMIWMGIVGAFDSTKRGAIIAYILSIFGQVGMIFFGIHVLSVWPYEPWYRYNVKKMTPMPGLQIDWLTLLNIILDLLIIAGWIYVMYIVREKLKRKFLCNLLLLISGAWLQFVLTGYYPGLYHMLFEWLM